MKNNSKIVFWCHRGDGNSLGHAYSKCPCSDSEWLVSHRISLCFQGVLPTGFYVDVTMCSLRGLDIWIVRWLRDGWRAIKHFLFQKTLLLI